MVGEGSTGASSVVALRCDFDVDRRYYDTNIRLGCSCIPSRKPSMRSKKRSGAAVEAAPLAFVRMPVSLAYSCMVRLVVPRVGYDLKSDGKRRNGVASVDPINYWLCFDGEFCCVTWNYLCLSARASQTKPLRGF